MEEARRLYPRPPAEPSPPKPSTNAMSRLLRMNMVMAMQARLE